jgi:hypothetical protein
MHSFVNLEVPLKNRFFLSLFVVIVSLAAAHAQDRIAAPQLDTALSFMGLRQEDFVADRIWFDDDTFLLPAVRTALRSPQAAYGVAKSFARSIPNDVSEAGRINEMADFISAKCADATCREIDAALAAAKPTLADPFEPMLTAFAVASRYRDLAFSQLTLDQQKTLLLAAPMWFEEEDDAADDTLRGLLQRSLSVPYDTTSRVREDSVLSLLPLVNREALMAATYAFARGLTLTVQAWKTTTPPFAITQISGADGLIIATRETPYGTFVLGGSGPNTYMGDFSLIIDLGGDDRYLSRAGGAVGVIGKSLAAVIDLGGNDLYLSPKAANFGCGVLGIGALVDMSGDDIYRSGAFSQGAAFCGNALFFDGGGDDTYRAGLFSQAAAVCGLAVLVDGGGRDVYDLTEYGQGFASTFGAAALLDQSGNDVYRAGGLVTHAPLRPEDYRSFAQGFAIGSRPRAGGGIALLHDVRGNDFYDGEIYAQGVGYWYSLGALFDDAGNDSYNATQYAQGAGIHLAAGVLEDNAGDDRFGSRFGPGQGGAHDLSVAFFHDRSGDDQYVMSGGQGMAINNSAAIFFDQAGNDAYFTQESSLSQGGVADARGFGNVAAFVDAEGHDIYATRGEQDSSEWLRGLFAVGYDVAYDSLRPREAQPDTHLVPQDTLRPIPDLFRDAARWEVTDMREIVRRARAALKARGIPAVRWVGEHKLNTNDDLEKRAISDLFKVYPDSAAPYLRAALETSNRDARKNAIMMFSEMKYKPGADVLLKKLRDPSFTRLRRQILYALGEIKDPSAVGLLMEFSRSSIEYERVAATVSLGKLQDAHGWPDIFARLQDSVYTVRSAAILALAAQNPDVVSELKDQLDSENPFYLERLLIASSRMAERWRNDAELKKQLPKLAAIARKFVDHPLPRVQGAALLVAAQSLEPAELDKITQKLDLSTDPVLKARVRQVRFNMR